MTSIFRSEEMSLCQLFLQPDAAYACISELGELGIVQFRDLNPNVNSFQRKFVNEVRRCDEMERKIRFLESEMKKDQFTFNDPEDNLDAPKAREMIDLENNLEKLDQELKEVNTNNDALSKNLNELTELKHNLSMTETFFEEHRSMPGDIVDGGVGNDLNGGGHNITTISGGIKLGFVSGVIIRERIPSFERMLWRVCRGNVLLKQAEIPELIEDPATGEKIHKTVFIVFFQGDQLKNRVQKICEGFRANVYPCPENGQERKDLEMNVITRIEDLRVVLKQTRDHRSQLLFDASRTLRTWQIKVRKMKAVYHTMNMFNNDVARKCFIAECWAPDSQLEQIRLALEKGSESSGSGSVTAVLNILPTVEQPPTHHRLNKVTQGFQNLVDAYGVATYREINPMPFVLITFPFLFAVMFGDAGHGIIVSCFALWMVIKENSLKDKWRNQEVWTIFFGGRYIILFMGLFSIYTGLIYNDIFSQSMNLFGSSWRSKFDNNTLAKEESVTLEPNPTPYNHTTTYVQMYSGNPYPIGLDPIWQISDNKITFTNSVKMKFAIIIGIMQMGFGVFLSLGNHRYFKHSYAIFVEFLPQIIFLSCIFFYLIILIFYKWTHFEAECATQAPSLLIHLINMILLSYPSSPDTPESSKTFFSFQKTLQTILLVIAVLCIPWMLLGKPIYIILQKKKKRAQNNEATNDVALNEANVDHPEEKEIDMSEVWVEQGIHTIEYFLGCISHTASYLRLWALSLAHAQLSEVLWQMVFKIGLGMDNVVGAFAMFIVFMPWSTLTVFILLLMEGLSAFLHALRLHWVEFQSKFYKGEGYPFVPFAFDTILDEIPVET